MSARQSNIMREHWRDPIYREKMRAAFLERETKRRRPPGKKPSFDGRKDGRFTLAVVRIDPEHWKAIRKLAVSRDISIAEIIRTYVQWGLETEGLDNG